MSATRPTRDNAPATGQTLAYPHEQMRKRERFTQTCHRTWSPPRKVLQIGRSFWPKTQAIGL